MDNVLPHQVFRQHLELTMSDDRFQMKQMFHEIDLNNSPEIKDLAYLMREKNRRLCQFCFEQGGNVVFGRGMIYFTHLQCLMNVKSRTFEELFEERKPETDEACMNEDLPSEK